MGWFGFQDMALTSRANDFQNSMEQSLGEKHLWGDSPAVLLQRKFPLSATLTTNVPRLRLPSGGWSQELSATRPPNSSPFAQASQSARAPHSDWVVPLPRVSTSSSSTPRRRSMGQPGAPPRSPLNTLSPRRNGMSTERAGNPSSPLSPAQRRPGPGDPEGYSDPGAPRPPCSPVQCD